MAPAPWSLLLLLLLAFLSPSFCSPPAKIPYADHCNSTVPASSPTDAPLDSSDSFQLSNGYFSGGASLLGPDSDSGTSSPNSLSFRTKYLHHTQTPGVLRLEGWLVLHGGNTRAFENWRSGGSLTRYSRTVSKEAVFDLSGFWSESTGKLCMVGHGSLKRHKGGSSPDLSAILKLNYPGKSSISTSLVNGSVQSLDAVGSPNYFDSISILAYAQDDYEYTMISQANKSCSRLEPQGESVRFDHKSYCRNVRAYAGPGQVFKFNHRNDCSGSNCGPFGASLKYSQTFMSLNLIRCSENGTLHMYIGFSNDSGYRYGNRVFLPDRSLVGEGHWDRSRNRLCLLACRILDAEGDSLSKASVGDCTIGLSLWFPAVLSIRSTSAAVGHIWSNLKESDPRYFSNVSFSRLGNPFGSAPGVKYNYTELEKVNKFCAENNVTKSEKRRYPDGSSFEDMSFDIYLANSKGESAWGRATPISIGEMHYGNARSGAYVSEDGVYHHYRGFEDPTVGTELHVNQTHWNVSYMISYTFNSASLDVNDLGEVSAEGIYSSETGILCMVGCLQYPNPLFATKNGKEVNSGSTDCEILINLQLPPLNPGVGDIPKGTIGSRREGSDPLFFDQLEASVSAMYRSQAVETLWRLDIEIVMVVISLTLYCVFVGIQFHHVKKHFPPISITMLAVLTLGSMIPLALNFGALFPKNPNQWYALQQNGSAQLEADEVIVRVMTMVAFLLHCRLLQVAWSSRSVEDDGKKGLWVAERRTLKSCLLLYLAGGLVAWFVHTATSHEVKVYDPGYIVERHRSLWEDLMCYAGLILDCFLLPQIILNMFWNSRDRALNPFFYVGTTMVRILPHLYDVYRAHHYVDFRLKWFSIYASRDGDFYSTVWDIIIPCLGLLFAFLIYLQQRFGGDCILPKKYRKTGGYEVVPAVGP